MQVQIRRILQMWIVSAVATMSLICGAGAAYLDVIVPTSLPITVSSNGKITTADGEIYNLGTFSIRIASIKVAAQNGWSLATKSDAFNSSSNDKKIAMSFNGTWMNADGTVDVSSFPNIPPYSQGYLDYSAALPMATTASSETAATATIVISSGYPTLEKCDGWKDDLKEAASLNDGWESEITEITFMDSYSATGQESASAIVDEDMDGSIKAYIIGSKVIIAGNGMGKIRATDCDSMFQGFTNLTSIDMSVLDTSAVEVFYSTFRDCAKIKKLDLTNLDTHSAYDSSSMFSGCTSLETIYVSDKWNMTNIEGSDDMFLDCTSLKGDIAFDSNYVDKTYAKTSGGYLTYKGATAKTLSLNIDPDNGTVDSYSIFSVPAKTNDGSD